ncbi:glycosyltransferase [Sphingomonas sp. CJ20]
MRRVGFVLATTGTGGTERYLLRLLAALPQDVGAVVFVRSATAGDLHQRFVAAGAELVYLPLGYVDPRRMAQFWRAIARRRLDALVDLTGIFGGVPLLLARFSGVQRRVAFHRRSTFAFRQTPWRRLFAWVSRLLVERSATAILSNSRAALALFHPRLLDADPRLAVFANPIDPAELAPSRSREATRAALGLDSDAFAVLHVGRVDPAKDHATLIHALTLAMAGNERVHAVLAGPGTAELVASLPAPFRARFRLLGNRADVADLYHAADLFVFPSITEGQPNALLEAMLAGLPVVASDIAPIREVVPMRGWDGLVPPRDADGFARAVSQCAADAGACASRRYAAETRGLTAPDVHLPRLFSILLPGADA